MRLQLHTNHRLPPARAGGAQAGFHRGALECYNKTMQEGPPKKISSTKNGFFESKNVHKEHFVVNGAEVDAIDVKPENPKTEIPVLVAPGWGATMKNFESGIEVLVKKGRHVLSLDHPRRGGTVPDSHNKEIEEWYKKKGKEYPGWPSAELRKANTILGLLEQKKLDKVDAIAHSEGAINVCIAAMLHPEKFTDRTIVLYNPAGIIGKDTLPRLVKGALANPGHPQSISEIPVTETETKRLKLAADEARKYVIKNPSRGLEEIMAISQAQIEDMLRYLREKGIKIIIVGAVDDTYFPMERMQKNKNVKYLDTVDGFLSVTGAHDQLKVDDRYISAIESMLKI